MMHHIKIVNKAHRQQGLSLVELMISLVLGLFVVGVIITLFVQSKNSYNQDEQVAQMQENGRYALQLISREVSHAGFLGGMSAVDSVEPDASATFTNDCADWFHPVSFPVEVYSASVANGKTCFSGVTVKADTEVLVVKRTAGKPTAISDIETDKFYFTTLGQGGNIFKSASNASVPNAYLVPSPWVFWEYSVDIYFIKDEDSDGDGESVPGLFRKRLIATGGAISLAPDELLVPGIRDFGLHYGIDSGEDDGVADGYVVSTDYGGINMHRVVSARVSVLVMSTDEDQSNTNNKSYSLYPSATSTTSVSGLTGSHYYGRVFSTTAQLRNNAYRIQIYNVSKTYQ